MKFMLGDVGVLCFLTGEELVGTDCMLPVLPVLLKCLILSLFRAFLFGRDTKFVYSSWQQKECAQLENIFTSHILMNYISDLL